MGRTLGIVALGLATIVGAAPPQEQEATGRVAEVEQWAEIFDDPARREWQLPNIVMRLLGPLEGARVADIGAGTGYFTRLLGWAVGENGRVWAVDIESAMLDHLMQREDLSPYDNIVPVVARPDDPRLPDGQVALILIVNTWHHIDGRRAYLERLHGALDRFGRVVIVDWHEGELPHGPPPGQKLEREAVVAEFEEAGWKLINESVALPYQYFLVFTPPRRP